MDRGKPTARVGPDARAAPRGRPFAPGVSGNPQGRPKGSRNKATLIAKALRSGEAEALVRPLIEKALKGNLPALRACFDRLLPPQRDRRVQFELPQLAAGDAVGAARSVLSACAAGTLSPREAVQVMRLVETYVRAKEVSVIEARRIKSVPERQA